MRLTLRLFILSCGLALAAPAAGPFGLAALAQGGGSPGAEAPRQIPLTQHLIDQLVAAQPAMMALQDKARNAQQPDPALQTKMDAIAKKAGFAGLEAFGEAADSVSIVLAGIDPETKTYVGPVAIIKKQIAQVTADKSLPQKDKDQTLQQMREALNNAGAVKPLPENIGLVVKNFDKLSEGFQNGE
jgi:hypothetical protein